MHFKIFRFNLLTFIVFIWETLSMEPINEDWGLLESSNKILNHLDHQLSFFDGILDLIQTIFDRV